jgi:zinc protease
VAILDSTANVASKLDALKDLGLRIKEIRTSDTTAMAVTAEQVKSVAQRYFGDDSLTVAHLLPQPSNAQAPRKPAMPLRHGEGAR